MKRAINLAALMLLLVVAATWITVLRPTQFGGDAAYILVDGQSMLPTYESGDLAITRRQGAYQPGDVVAYRLPPGEVGAGRIIFHRIVDTHDGAFLLQGDNNPDIDPWFVNPDDIVGAAWLHVPVLGRALAAAHDPATLAALAASLVFTWLILRPTRRPASRSTPIIG